MAYSAQTFVAGEQPTTAKWNLLWSNDASFNDGSGLAAGSVPSSALKALLNAATSEVATNQTTASATYTDLATVQSCTVTVGANGLLLVGYGAQMANSVAQYMAVALSGANTYAASDNDIAFVLSNGVASKTKLFTGLAAGSTTVTAKFRVDTGTGAWLRRNIWAVTL